jgi:hypothetical protein
MKNLLCFLCFIPLSLLQADVLNAKIEATFDGTSTLHDFTGLAKSEAVAEWSLEDNTATLSIPEVVFDVKTLSTDHKKRDKNMLKMFEPGDHPTISGSIDGWKLSQTETSDQILILQIHGQRLEVPVKVEAYTPTDEGIELACSFSLSLKACDLKRPSVLGIIRVGDEVNLQIKTLLVKP